MTTRTTPASTGILRKRSAYLLAFVLIFIAVIVIRMSFVGLLPLWREDAFHYLDKAQEIMRGDFSLKSQDIGLPLFYALFLKIFGSGDLLRDLPLAQILLALVESLIFLPLILITLRIFGRKAALLAGILFALWPGLIYWTSQGYSEGLFTLFLLAAFYFLVRMLKNRVWILAAAGLVGLAFYVRVNGIFFLPLVFAFAFIIRREIPKWNWRWFLYAGLTFVLVVTPYFVIRASLYDSPMHYGMAAKFLFLDNDQQLFDPEFNPTLSSYLATHSAGDIARRAWNGVSTMVEDTFGLNPFLMTLAFLGLLVFRRRRELVFHGAFFFWFLGLFWIYGAVRNERFVLPLMPLALILASGLTVRIFEKARPAVVWLGAVVFFFGFLYAPDMLRIRGGLKWEGAVWKDARVWGEWMDLNLPAGAVIAVREGIDIVDFTAPELRLVTIPNRETDAEILDFFRKENVSFFGLGTGGLEAADWNRIPALREFRRRTRWPFITRVYDNEDLKWKMEVYRIDWERRGVEAERGDGDEVEAEALDVSGGTGADPGASAGFCLVVEPGAGAEKAAVIGPLRGVPEGRWRLSIRMKVESGMKVGAAEDKTAGETAGQAGREKTAAEAEVKENNRNEDSAGADFRVGISVAVQRLERVLWKKVYSPGDFPAGGGWSEFEAEIELDTRRDLHFRFVVQGPVRLSVDRIRFAAAAR